MKKLISIGVLLLIFSTGAQAAVTFDFEAATTGGGFPGAANNVSAYMTGEYGSSVTATGAAAWSNDLAGADWVGKTGTDQWLRAYGNAPDTLTPGAFQISFDDDPIHSVAFDWFVFDAEGYPNVTFTFMALDAGGNLVEPMAQFANNNVGGHYEHDFGSAVTQLYFSNEGYHDVGIDNLVVTAESAIGADVIPAPGALLLGSMGMGIVGWLRRRRAL